jgi:HEAT repeat protein
MGGVRAVSVIVYVLLAVSVSGMEPAVAGRLADLKSSAARIRARAASQLAEARDPAIVPALIEALADTDAAVRRAAAKSLGEQRHAKAVPALVKALRDGDMNVRFYAAHALGQIKDKASAKGLLVALHDPAYGVRDQAAWALRELHDPAIADGLYAELAREDADVPHVAWLIKQLAGERAVPELANLLKHDNATVRGRALRLLVDLKTRKAVPALIEALGDPDLKLRTMAVRALAGVRDERSIEPLKALAAKEPDPALREMAKETVRRLTMHPAIVAYWSFDDSDGKTVMNEVPIGGNGEIMGGAKLVAGKSGKGLECGEGRFVELGQPPMLPIASRPLTFVAWIKPTAPTGVVIARGGAFSGFSLYLKDGLPKFGIHLVQDGPDYIAVGKKPVPMGEWTHLAGVVRQNAVEVWVNGELAGTCKTPSFLLNNAGQGLEIGFDAGNSPCELMDAFVGVIDEVRMYHADLKAEDLLKQYNREK